ncbi:MAG: DUF3592 domain-containing protein [Lachnospiraceae bacterium]|nr:DUF3592 domain-containing protein [Lachnospiraceae bacterium]
MLYVGIVLVFLGIFFMVHYVKRKNQNKRRTALIQATCTNFVEKADSEGDTYTKYYTLTYVVDGKQYSIANQILPGDPQIGDPIMVNYNPKKPQDAGFDYQDKGKEHYSFFIGLGLFLLGIIILIL